MAKVTKEIISPLHVNEQGDTFICLDGKAFLVKENTIEEAHIMSSPGEFRNLVLALENFQVSGDGITWYNGVTKIRYIAETNKTYLNNSEILGNVSNHLLLSGVVKYDQKSKIDLFEFACANHGNYSTLEFVQKIEEGSVKCYVMKLNEDFFVYRMNEANKIYKFGKLNANEVYDYVLEQTGYELVDMTQELLEGARKEAAEKQAEIDQLQEMIAFLKDQRGIIAEADKSVEEIKEADTLINSEIKRLEEEVEAIRNGKNLEEDTIEEAGEEAGQPAEEIESEAKEVDNPEKREKEGEEATDEAPEASGEDGADDVALKVEEADEAEDEVAPETEETEETEDDDDDDEAEDGDDDDEAEDSDDDDDDDDDDVSEDEAKEIEKELTAEGEPEKAEENQEELEASYDESEKKSKEEALTEWAVRGMDAIYDNGIPEELREKARKLGVRMTYDDDASPYSGALSLSSKNKKAILKIAAITGHLDDIKDGTYEIEEAINSKEKTNEAEIEESEIDRADGYVPGTLRFKVSEYAEGTELKVDAEGYTTAGSDDSVNVFIDEQPVKVLKREIALADTETI